MHTPVTIMRAYFVPIWKSGDHWSRNKVHLHTKNTSVYQRMSFLPCFPCMTPMLRASCDPGWHYDTRAIQCLTFKPSFSFKNLMLHFLGASAEHNELSLLQSDSDILAKNSPKWRRKRGVVLPHYKHGSSGGPTRTCHSSSRGSSGATGGLSFAKHQSKTVIR